ncbi:Uncharacterised protein [uncultured Blautia sp.]|nr:Uncharacterised protein [uncultured Blautia sp.]
MLWEKLLRISVTNSFLQHKNLLEQKNASHIMCLTFFFFIIYALCFFTNILITNKVPNIRMIPAGSAIQAVFTNPAIT